MKRFWLFAGEDYYPKGGYRDFKGDYNSVAEAMVALSELEGIEWWHVIDILAESGKRIAILGNDPYA